MASAGYHCCVPCIGEPEEWPLVDAIEMQALVQVVKRDAGASCRCEGLACHPVLYPVYQRSVPADTRSR